MTTVGGVFPILHTGLLELGGTGGATLQLGENGVAPMAIDAGQDFSLSGWVRIESRGVDTIIFSQGAFELGVSNNHLFCTTPYGGARVAAQHVIPDIDVADSSVPGALPVTEPTGVPAFGSGPTSGWMHVAVVYRATPGAASITFYMNGDCDEVQIVGGQPVYQSVPVTPSSGSGQGQAMVLGSVTGGKIALWQWCLFNKALDTETVEQLVYHVPDVTEANLIGLVAYYDFSSGLDGVTGFNEAVLWGDVVKKVATPGAAFGYHGYSSSATSPPTLLNNGDAYTAANADQQLLPPAFSAASSVQGWAYVDPTVVLSSGASMLSYVFSAAGALTIGLRLDPATRTATLHGYSVAATGTAVVPWDEITGCWVNLAAVAQGKGMALYLQGQPLAVSIVNSTGSGMYTYPPNMQAYYQPTQPVAVELGYNFFGYIQSMSLWSRALQPEEVLNFMSANPPDDAEMIGLAGYYDCSLLPANNLVTGNPLVVAGHAAVTDFRLPPIRLNYQQQGQQRALVRHRSWQREQKLLAGLGAGSGNYGFDASKIDPSQFSAARWDALLDEVIDLLPPDWSAEQVAALRQHMHDEGGAAFMQAAEAKVPQEGMFTHERIGDEYVFYYHGAEGAQRVMTQSTRDLTPQGAWLIDVAATLFFGLLWIFKVPTTPKAVVKAVANLIRKNSRLALAFAEVFVGTLSTTMYVGAVKALFDNDAVKTFVNEVLDSLSWWNFLMFVVELAIELLEMLIPGLAQALLLAKIVTVIVNLGLVYSQRPAEA